MFTLEQVDAALDAVIEKYPAGKNERCFYSRHGRPHCVIGHVFDELGFGAPPSTERNTWVLPGGREIGNSISEYDDLLDQWFDLAACRRLDVVQQHADSYASWVESVRMAREEDVQ